MAAFSHEGCRRGRRCPGATQSYPATCISSTYAALLRSGGPAQSEMTSSASQGHARVRTKPSSLWHDLAWWLSQGSQPTVWFPASWTEERSTPGRGSVHGLQGGRLGARQQGAELVGDG